LRIFPKPDSTSLFLLNKDSVLRDILILMDISIIILTFNAKDITIRMLDSLRDSLKFIASKINYEVIVVDNGSTDGITDLLEQKSISEGWFTLIKGSNIGFSKGNNMGVEQSNSNSKYVLFLNPDVILEKDSIEKVYDYMENSPSDISLVTCKVDLWSGGLDWDCHRGFPTPWRSFCYFTGLEKFLGKKFPTLFGGYHLLDKNMNEIHEIDACLGAFIMIRRVWGEKIKWWPTDYFLNGEDIDLCYQLKVINNTKIIYYPFATIVHYKGASKGTKNVSQKITKATSEVKTLQINSGVKSMEIFYKKYYADKYPFIINTVVYLGIWLLHKKRLILGKE
jgi:GT2 family glycosyltransferase